jgi:hypothetical protein
MYFSRHYQIVVKIKPLYLTHYTYYLTFNTTRVVKQQLILVILVLNILHNITGTFTGTYCSLWESLYKTCLYGDF